MRILEFRVPLVLASLGLMFGCTTTSPENELSSRYENIIFEKSGLDLSDYRSVMLGALEIDFPQQSRQPARADVRRLAKEFRDAFFRELQNSASGLQNRIVDMNGGHVLLLKPRLVGVTSTSALKSDAGGDTLQVDRSLTLDVSLLDSLSGELLLRARESRSNSAGKKPADVDWVKVSEVAGTWARGVVAFLDQHLAN